MKLLLCCGRSSMHRATLQVGRTPVQSRLMCTCIWVRTARLPCLILITVVVSHLVQLLLQVIIQDVCWAIVLILHTIQPDRSASVFTGCSAGCVSANRERHILPGRPLSCCNTEVPSIDCVHMDSHQDSCDCTAVFQCCKQQSPQ